MCGKAVIISGPTSSGKTAFAHAIFQPGDCIINADSRQIYKGFNIGSAKPCAADIKKYNYKLIDFLPPDVRYSAYRFMCDANSIIEDGRNTDNGFFYITGGTVFYLNALLHGLAPELSIHEDIKAITARIYAEEGILGWQRIIRERDPYYFSHADICNPRRLERAMHILLASGLTITEFRQQQKPAIPRAFFIIMLFVNRNVLKKNIATRTESMIRDGLFDEVSALSTQGIRHDCPAMQSIGYKEALEFLHKKADMRTSIEHIKIRTRQYAKQQMTWIKKMTGVLFFFDEKERDISADDSWFFLIPEIFEFDRKTCHDIVYGGAKMRMSLTNAKKNIRSVLRVFYEN